MIITTLYFLALCIVVYKTPFFGLFRDEVTGKKMLLAAFVFKCLGIGAFYMVYARYYGGIQAYDTQHFYHDSKLLHDIAGWNGGQFLRVMFGFYDASPGTQLFQDYMSKAEVWDKDPTELLYNDNRLVIRLHALIHFISFGSYWVHALFSCFMGFAGIVCIYKAFRFLFKGKENLLLWSWVAFPGVWFWSSSVLKEGPALCLMGLLFLTSKKLWLDKVRKPDVTAGFLIAAILCFFLKPYLMLPLLVFTMLFFIIQASPLKPKLLTYLAGVVMMLIGANAAVMLFGGRSAAEVLAARQRTFVDVSRGGIFLLDPQKFIRLPYDHRLLAIDSTAEKPLARIRKGAAYMYWEHSHQQDTLYCRSNADTLNTYSIQYVIVPANSTVNLHPMDGTLLSLMKQLPFALYITTLKPFFFDSRNTLDLMASVENLLILLALGFTVYGLVVHGTDKTWSVYFLSMVIVVLMITGITSPNIGAIERYRALVLPFLLMSALRLFPSSR